jgi:hypothetical protein
MANYFASIPIAVRTEVVFEAINSHVVGGMDGLVVAAFGDHTLASCFDPATDEVLKFCVSSGEILEKVSTGSIVDDFDIRIPGESVRITRDFIKRTEDDASVLKHDRYNLIISLIDAPEFGSEAAINKAYEQRLNLPVQPPFGNRFCKVYGATKDVQLFYSLGRHDLLPFLEAYAKQSAGRLEMFGAVQERGDITENVVDAALHPFRSPYAVYASYLAKYVSNYPMQSRERFCKLIDNCPENLKLEVGRSYLSFAATDGRNTRSLGGNQFSIYGSKGKRRLSVGFEQYADEDIPVRAFSGGVRQSLKGLGIKI